MRVPCWEREASNDYEDQHSSIQRAGADLSLLIDGTDYAAFIWQMGKQFRGRIEGHPQVPQYTGRTAVAVRDALQLWLVTHVVA